MCGPDERGDSEYCGGAGSAGRYPLLQYLAPFPGQPLSGRAAGTVVKPEVRPERNYANDCSNYHGGSYVLADVISRSGGLAETARTRAVGRLATAQIDIGP